MEKPKVVPKAAPMPEPVVQAPKPPPEKKFCDCGREAMPESLQCWNCAHRA